MIEVVPGAEIVVTNPPPVSHRVARYIFSQLELNGPADLVPLEIDPDADALNGRFAEDPLTNLDAIKLNEGAAGRTVLCLPLHGTDLFEVMVTGPMTADEAGVKTINSEGINRQKARKAKQTESHT